MSHHLHFLRSSALAMTCAAALVMAMAIPAGATTVVTATTGLGAKIHGYEWVTTGKQWDQARYDATQMTFLGLSGHLVTIRNAAENAVALSAGSGDRWIGLTDNPGPSTIDGAVLGGTEAGNTSVGWVWVTGEPTGYFNWNGGEPNNSGTGEDAVHFTGAAGLWNDNKAGATLPGEAAGPNLGSVVEYDLNKVPGVNFEGALNFRQAKADGTFPGTVGGPQGATVGGIRDIPDAELLLSGVGVASQVTGWVDRVNALDGGGEGHFAPSDGFPITGDNYVAEYTGQVYIPSAGAWTFGTNTDDGSELTVDGNVKTNDVLSGPHDHFATFFFGIPGWKDMRLVFFEAGGGAEVELFAAMGSFTSFTDPNANFQLVGDTLNGGLPIRTGLIVPEPMSAGLALMGLGALGAGLRRRRSA
jgi:Lectin C-type domain/PA14 domain/PEP-CTERM motif